MTESLLSAIQLSRRRFLAATLAGGAALTACGRPDNGAGVVVGDFDPIAAAEAARPHSGKSVSANLVAAQTDIDLGGTVARTLAYNDQVPGPLIRAAVGDELAVTVVNGLAHPSSVHWHGIALRNDMDGAAPATPNIGPAGQFTYRFTSPYPGTYWAHPHTGLDADYGLYLPVISTIRPNPAVMTPSGSCCSTTGPPESAAAPNRSTTHCGQ